LVKSSVTVPLAQYVHRIALAALNPPPANPTKSNKFNAFPPAMPLAHKLQSPLCLPSWGAGVLIDYFVRLHSSNANRSS
jgi:hypothetical protein